MTPCTTPTLLASWLTPKQLDVVLLVSGNTTGKEDGMSFSVVRDEGYHALVVAEGERCRWHQAGVSMPPWS